jgi:hypothetical protein
VLREQLKAGTSAKLNGVKKLIQAWYAVLLFVATLVWGLGDRFYELVHDHTIGCWDVLMRLLFLQSH